MVHKNIQKTAYRLGIILFLLVGLQACGTKNKDDRGKAELEKFRSGLKEQPLGDSGYRISLPEDFTIFDTQGPDFVVYYFGPSDTLAAPTFSGGMYFGGAPQAFESAMDSCKRTTFTAALLGKPAKWTEDHCPRWYSIQTIAATGSGEWDAMLHAFGSAVTENDKQKLLFVFQTLKRS